MRLLLKLLSRLSLPALHALGAGAGWLMYGLAVKQRRRARDNITACLPGLSEAERDRLVQRALSETAKSFFEMAALWNWPGERVMRLVTDVHGAERIRQAIDRGEGVLIIMPHLGSWELTNVYCSSLAPMTTLYKPPRRSQLESMMLEGRQSLGARLVPTDANGVRALYRALARHEIVGILPDQFPKPGSGVFVSFFGHPAYTMTLAGRLVQKSGARVVYAFAERLPEGRGFRMHFLDESRDFSGCDLKQITQAISLGIERCVRLVPHQYQWTYKRFRPDVIDVGDEA